MNAFAMRSPRALGGHAFSARAPASGGGPGSAGPVLHPAERSAQSVNARAQKPSPSFTCTHDLSLQESSLDEPLPTSALSGGPPGASGLLNFGVREPTPGARDNRILRRVAGIALSVDWTHDEAATSH